MADASPLGAILSTEPPVFREAAASKAARLFWGIEGRFTPLTSERDVNFRVETDNGSFVLKLANPAESPEITDFQIRALLHLEPAGLTVPHVVRTLEGKTEAFVDEGRLRLLTYLEGEMLHRAAPSPELRRSVARMNAALTAALAGFTHPAARHVLQWDIQHAAKLAPLLPDVPEELRPLAESALHRFEAEALPLLPGLPRQVCHADLNPHNVVVSVDHRQVTGVLDFGDMVETPRVCDLGVAAAYQVDPEAPAESLAEYIRAYTEVLPLTEAEVRLIPILTEARWLTTLCIAAHRAKRQPENATYILRNVPLTRAGLLAFAQLDRNALQDRLLAGARLI
jgi:hydroxylysine kinase